MSKQREAEIREILAELKNQNSMVLLFELLTLRRSRYRDKLESEESSEIRGRSKECKDLLQIFN